MDATSLSSDTAVKVKPLGEAGVPDVQSFDAGDVETQVLFFLRDADKQKFLIRDFTVGEPEGGIGGSYAKYPRDDELIKNMQEKETHDSGYMAKLAEKGYKPQYNLLNRYGLSFGRMSLSDYAEHFETHIKSHPSLAHRMRYEVPFEMRIRPRLAAISDDLRMIATPTAPGVYNDFILSLMDAGLLRAWKDTLHKEQQGKTADESRFPSEIFKIVWAGNGDMPKGNDVVYTGDRVQLAVLRRSEEDHIRGNARPMFASGKCMGATEWKYHSSTVFTFHYGPIYWETKWDESSKVPTIINQVQMEEKFERQ